jgi:hypothetical protein
MNDRAHAAHLMQPAAAPRGRHLPVAGVAALLGALACFAATAPIAAASASLPSRSAATGTGGATQFALIINGDDSFTHNYNVTLSLASLSQLGYAPRNTLVLAPPASADGGGSAAAGDAGAPAPWRQPATEQGLRQAFAQLRGRMRPGDLLLVYLTGHGYRMFGRTSLELQGGSITARELMQRLGELPFGKLILIADQCYSGGFASAALALGRNVVAVSSTDDRHEVRCEPFIRPLWLAAVAAESDTRGNGFVSVEEAFQVAADALRQGGAGSVGEAPRIAVSGTCSGHENAFGETAPRAAAGPGGGNRDHGDHGDHADQGDQRLAGGVPAGR